MLLWVHRGKKCGIVVVPITTDASSAQISVFVGPTWWDLQLLKSERCMFWKGVLKIFPTCKCVWERERFRRFEGCGRGCYLSSKSLIKRDIAFAEGLLLTATWVDGWNFWDILQNYIIPSKHFILINDQLHDSWILFWCLSLYALHSDNSLPFFSL